MRPIKRPKVSAKAKKADENSLSAAAIVDPFFKSNKQSANESGLHSKEDLSCVCGSTFSRHDNLSKHQKKCNTYGMSVKLLDLVN